MTQLKTELDIVTKTGSKNILRPNFGLRLLCQSWLKSRKLLRSKLSWTRQQSAGNSQW